MNYFIFMLIFFGLGIIYLFLGIIGARKVKNEIDYFLAKRKLGLLPATLTLLATQIGSGMLLGTAKEAYKIGYYGLMYVFGMVLGFLILGLGLAARMRSLKIATTSEIFETKYNSPMLNNVSSIFSAITLLGIVVGQIIASRLFLQSLGIQNELILISFWLIIITYTTIGGLKSVVLTDSFQIVLVVLIFSALFIYLIHLEPTSFFSAESIIEKQKIFHYEGIKISDIASLILMPALFSLIGQDLAQRFFASRTNYIATIAALLSSIFLALFAIIPIYFGIKAKFLGLTFIGNPILYVVKQLKNDFILIIASCGIIAAITSTGDSVLIAISSNLYPLFKNKKNNLTSARSITFICGLIAFIVSYYVPGNVIDIIIGSYSLSVSCLFVPIVIGYFKNNLNKNAAICSIFFGLMGFILFRFYPIVIPKEIASLILSFIGYIISSVIR